jgi:hypothetical protein
LLKCFLLSIIDPTVNGSIKIDNTGSSSNINVFGQGGASTMAGAGKTFGMVCGPNGCH